MNECVIFIVLGILATIMTLYSGHVLYAHRDIRMLIPTALFGLAACVCFILSAMCFSNNI